MSVQTLQAELAEVRQCIRDMEVLEDWVHSLGRKVSARSDAFAGVSIDGAWGGKAAREFSNELKRTRTTLSNGKDHTDRASRTITFEIGLKKLEAVKLEAAITAQKLWDAAQDALSFGGGS